MTRSDLMVVVSAFILIGVSRSAGFRAKYAKSPRSGGILMAHLVKRWDTPGCLFGDLVVLGFLVVQALDGVFTYLGVTIWGPDIEANPLIGSVVAVAGLGVGLTATKLVAAGFGIVLHLRRVHNLVALLTAIYVVIAILPWTTMLLRW